MTDKLYTKPTADDVFCGYFTMEKWVELLEKQGRPHLINTLIEETEEIMAKDAIKRDKLRVEIEKAVALETKRIKKQGF